MQKSSPKKRATVATTRNIAITNQTVMIVARKQWTQFIGESCLHSLFSKTDNRERIH